MKIAFLGTAHPFRGGLAAFNERLAQAYQKQGDEVKIFTFTTQYPNFLFPGKSQFSDSPAPLDIKIERTLSSINPISWFKTAEKINACEPDIVVTRFWLPFMGLALGSVLRRLNKNIKVVCIVDNLIPHEKRAGDKIFTKYFLPPVDGFICMSEAVKNDFKQFKTKAPIEFSPHPIYDYGELTSKEVARGKLQLNPTDKIILFFGIIRDYKGLDWLIEAFSQTRYEENGYKLLIAGKFYTDNKPYLELISKHELNDFIILHDRFISDSDVGLYFNSANLVVQPYKHATQSGVAQIAYHFEKPMIVTNVGGLGEIVPNNIAGYVVEPEVDAIAKGIYDFFVLEKEEDFIAGVRQEKTKYSWDKFIAAMAKLYQ
ncbi:MAG: glycosyltransferase [Crocinitomicaceae bacterium]|nr:glycosyltransferase [Crocinitomicaceae bacterium]